jgi:aminoglycoside/choline kinase family phosphotransferase
MKTPEEMIVFARETLGLRKEISVELSPLIGRGSDRTYFRFRWNSKNSVILAHYQPNRIENGYFADIACFLLDHDIPVPRIIRHDAATCLVIMQDLGDTDLWSLRNEPWKIRKNLYQKTLVIAHKLHTLDENLFPSTRIRLMEPFGPDLYRWERTYFLNNFVHDLCRITLEPKLEQQLEMELGGLAQQLISRGHELVHRDLQSQNVLIFANAPFLIDFQGMRFGTRFYDLGSLLWDPYVSFSEGAREELLNYYYGLSKPESDWKGFEKAFLKASAQRLMQALGAYGHLGLHRGLRNYLEHVPAGLFNLGTVAEGLASLPILLDICSRCAEALAKNKIEFGSFSESDSNQDIR